MARRTLCAAACARCSPAAVTLEALCRCEKALFGSLVVRELDHNLALSYGLATRPQSKLNLFKRELDLIVCRASRRVRSAVFTGNFRQSLNGRFDDPAPVQFACVNDSAGVQRLGLYFSFRSQRSPRNTVSNDLVTQPRRPRRRLS